jgi:hypothetical protein
MIFNMIGIEKLYEINSWIILTKTYTNYIINRLITEKKQSVNVVTETAIEAPSEPLKSDNESENIKETPADLSPVTPNPQDNNSENTEKLQLVESPHVIDYDKILLNKLLFKPKRTSEKLPEALVGALINAPRDASKQDFIREILRYM